MKREGFVANEVCIWLMTATINPVMTEQEYLKLEEKATVRHEFINGKLYEMPGGTMYHEKVITNTLRILLRKTDLNVFAQGMRVRPPDTKNYFYPDVVVTNEKVSASTFIESPLLIAEVLSPSTRANDISDKFIAYRTFPSLAYYLLVEPRFCSITLIYKGEEGNWESEVYNQLTDSIPLPQLNIDLSVSGIYDGLNWVENL